MEWSTSWMFPSIQIRPFECGVFFVVNLFLLVAFLLQIKDCSDFVFLLRGVLLNSIFLGSHPWYQSLKVLRVVLNILLLLFSVASEVLFFLSIPLALFLKKWIIFSNIKILFCWSVLLYVSLFSEFLFSWFPSFYVCGSLIYIRS